MFDFDLLNLYSLVVFKLFIIFYLFLSSCAYHLGYDYKKLPRDIKSLQVPIFKNDTLEVGPEVYFTNQLIEELKRSQVAKLKSDGSAEGVLEGRIMRISRQRKTPEAKTIGQVKNRGMVNLPEGTFYYTELLLRVKVELRLRKKDINRVVWTQIFEDEVLYSTARLALQEINTSDPNYTDSEDKRVMNELASIMMQEAVGRLSENF